MVKAVVHFKRCRGGKIQAVHGLPLSDSGLVKFCNTCCNSSVEPPSDYWGRVEIVDCEPCGAYHAIGGRSGYFMAVSGGPGGWGRSINLIGDSDSSLSFAFYVMAWDNTSSGEAYASGNPRNFQCSVTLKMTVTAGSGVPVPQQTYKFVHSYTGGTSPSTEGDNADNYSGAMRFNFTITKPTQAGESCIVAKVGNDTILPS